MQAFCNTCSDFRVEKTECFYEPVSLVHMQYTSALRLSAQQCWISLRTSSLWEMKAYIGK